jgi:hypothetical protein
MRLNEPRLPAEPESKYDRELSISLYQFFRDVANQLNGVTEGQIGAIHNTLTAAPTTGTFKQGDFVRNGSPSELGTAGGKYVITGWICTVSGTPGTFLQCRSLTGN